MKRLPILVCLAVSLLALLAPLASVAAPSLPVRRLSRLPVEPFPGGGSVPAYKLRAGDPKLTVAPADLAFDPAVSAGPGVRKILAEVGNDPYAAYRWVRDKVEYLPYFGVKAGAEGTAWSQMGNDFDQAALLAALLRSQNIPSRFVYGVVRVEAKVLADWCGMASAEEAYQFLVQGGVPVRPILVSGIVKYVEMSHCWLEARIPIANPGYQGPGESVWIPLDPSFKRHSVTRGQDLFTQLNFQQEEFLLDYLQLADDSSPEDYFRDLLRGKLAEYGDVSTLADTATRIAVVPEGDGSLPTAMPPELNVLGVIWEEALIPDVYHYRIRLTLWDGHGDGGGVTTGDIRVTIPSAFFSEHALTVSYVPATAEDQALADGTQSKSPLDMAVRNEIRLRPQLLVDGKPITEFFSGDFLESGIPGLELPDQPIPANIGFHQKLLVETLAPAKDPTETLPLNMGGVERELQVGGIYALGCTGGLVSAGQVGTGAAALNDLRQSGTSEQILSASLSLAALQWVHKAGLSASAIASFLGVRHFEEPVLMLCGIHPTGGFDPGGVFFDIYQFTMALVSRDGREDRERAFMFLTGLQSSYYEHKVLSDVFQTTAVSAVRILKHVQSLGVSPLVLDGDNPDLPQTLAGLMGLSADQKKEILDKVMGQGWKLIIPPQATTLERWSGWGYIVWDPETGAGGYMISGGLAGGNMSWDTPYFLTQLYESSMGGKEFVVFSSVWVDDLGREVSWLSFSGDPNIPFNITVIIWPEDTKRPDDFQIAADRLQHTIQKPTTFEIAESRKFVLLGINWHPGNIIKYEPLGTGGIAARVDDWKETCTPADLTPTGNTALLVNKGMTVGYTCKLSAQATLLGDFQHTDSAMVQIVARNGDVDHDLPTNPYSYWDIIGPKVAGFFDGYPAQPNVGGKEMLNAPYYVSRESVVGSKKRTTYFMVADSFFTPYGHSGQVNTDLDKYLARAEKPNGIQISFANYKATDRNPFTKDPGRCDDYVRSTRATLTLAMYDLDDDKDFPELVRIKLNDEYLLDSEGFQVYLQRSAPDPGNKWQLFHVDFPTCKLKAPMRSKALDYPKPEVNVITLDLDGLNQGYRLAIGWAVIQFDALSPIILVHGANSGSDFWDKGRSWWGSLQEIANMDFIDTLQDRGIPFDRSITVRPGNRPGEARIGDGISSVLAGIEKATKEFGAFSFNVVAHSKGGLWTRAALHEMYSGSSSGSLKNLSLKEFVTLATPHTGSVLANYVQAFVKEAIWQEDHGNTVYMDVSVPSGQTVPTLYREFRQNWWPQNPTEALDSNKNSIAYDDLDNGSVLSYFTGTINSALKNHENFDKSKPLYLAVTADADNDNSDNNSEFQISNTEFWPLDAVLEPNDVLNRVYLFNHIYRLQGEMKSFDSSALIEPGKIYLYNAHRNATFAGSDIYVPLPSARGEGAVGDFFGPIEQTPGWWNGSPFSTNHATVCSHEVADHLVNNRLLRALW